MAATLLLEKKEDRKKQQRDNTNGAQTDSGFSSKSENIKEKISENNTTGEKSSKQSKTAEQQNSETSSENQDMDVDKPNIRGMYKLLKNIFKHLLIFFLLFYTICRKTRVKKLKVFWQTIVKKPKESNFHVSLFERSKYDLFYTRVMFL